MKELPEKFYGIGEVKGKLFKQVLRSDNAYLYECTGENFKPHYEVFRRRENDRFGVVSYPKANSFGKWAWTYNNLLQAEEKFNQINKGENNVLSNM